MSLRTLPERVVPRWFIAGLEALDDYLADRAILDADLLLWTAVITASVLDVLTTIIGLGIGLTEGNAVARAFIHTYGEPGIGALKLVGLVILVLVWVGLSDRSGTIVLAGFAVVSSTVVLWNLLTIILL